MAKLEKMASGADIMIGLEDESGEARPVEIDEADDSPLAAPEADAEQTPPKKEEEFEVKSGCKRRVSITERVLKSRNSEQQMASLQQEAENRKKELTELLSEHAQLVHSVEVMESPAAEEAPAAPGQEQQEQQGDKENRGHEGGGGGLVEQ